jgi:hypothetical protein
MRRYRCLGTTHGIAISDATHYDALFRRAIHITSLYVGA